MTLYKPQTVGGKELKSVICLAESAKMREMFKFTLGVSRQRYIYLFFFVSKSFTHFCVFLIYFLNKYLACICLKKCLD